MSGPILPGRSNSNKGIRRLQKAVRLTGSNSNARQLPKYPLMTIPQHIRTQILMKIHCVELIRLRKTCSNLNSLVEKNKTNYSTRTGIGVSVTISLASDNGRAVELKCRHAGKRTHVIVCASCLERQFSGISIDYLSWDFTYSETAKLKEEVGIAEKILKKLELTCGEFEVQGEVPLEMLIPFTNLVKSRKTKIDGVAISEKLPILLAAPNRATFDLSIGNPEEIVSNMEEVVNFKNICVYECINAGQLEKLFSRLGQMTDFGCLNRLEFPYPDPRFTYPLTKIIWSMENIPNHPQQELRPPMIRKLDLANGKCAMISNCFSIVRVKMIFLNDNPEEIIEYLINELHLEGIDWRNKRKYLEASEEDQLGILITIYMETVVEK